MDHNIFLLSSLYYSIFIKTDNYFTIRERGVTAAVIIIIVISDIYLCCCYNIIIIIYIIATRVTNILPRLSLIYCHSLRLTLKSYWSIIFPLPTSGYFSFQITSS